jgi:hypothetical protein
VKTRCETIAYRSQLAQLIRVDYESMLVGQFHM